MLMETMLIKIGGHEVENPDFLTELARVIKGLNTATVIVHGGGKEITTLSEQLGITPRMMDGVRITDAPSLTVAEMVLCGTVNKRLVRYLLAGGVEALGMSGVDRGFIYARKMAHPTVDMGFTGSVIAVRCDVLFDLLERDITPVIAPICRGSDSSYNVNADHVAGAIAVAMGASRAVFLTNVEGVLVNNQAVPRLTSEQAKSLIADGTIFGGMIPKVETALQALADGVSQVVITNLSGLAAGGGTVFVRDTIA
jgi:acetylglutamate kinase